MTVGLLEVQKAIVKLSFAERPFPDEEEEEIIKRVLPIKVGMKGVVFDDWLAGSLHVAPEPTC